MPFNKLCSPSTPQGWSCTAAWGLNYLMNDCSQRARQSWFWCTYGWIQKCVLSLQKRVLKTKRYSKVFHHYPGTTFFSCHVCLYFFCQQESRTSPNIIYLFISTSKRSLGFLATELQSKAKKWMLSLQMWATENNNQPGACTKPTNDARNNHEQLLSLLKSWGQSREVSAAAAIRGY